MSRGALGTPANSVSGRGQRNAQQTARSGAAWRSLALANARRRLQARAVDPAAAPELRALAAHVAALEGDEAARTTRSRERRAARFGHLAALWRSSTLQRVRHCCRFRAAGVDGAAVRSVGVYRGGKGGAFMGGVQRCASVWACPVCGSKIRQERAVEVSAALRRALELGYGVAFITLTMPHDATDKLKATLSAVLGAWRSMLQGRRGQAWRKSAGVLGLIRATEATHGRAGWHPHLHIAAVTAAPLTAAELAGLELSLGFMWATAITKAGYRSPLPGIGVRVEAARDVERIGEYITDALMLQGTEKGDKARPVRVGAELARADLKQANAGNRTPWEILASYAETGDADDLALWHEWEQATRGRRCIEWSRGLREKLLGTVEPTDEEIAARKEDGTLVLQIDADDWDMVVHYAPTYVRRILAAAESATGRRARRACARELRRALKKARQAQADGSRSLNLRSRRTPDRNVTTFQVTT